LADITKDWKKYEDAKRYNNNLKPNYYTQVDTNLAFFSGDQWRNCQSNGMPQPVFNFIKRVITFFVSAITSSNVKINYEPLTYRKDSPDEKMTGYKKASDIATAETGNLFEKFKMETKIRDALFDAATMGDVAAHIYFDRNKKPYGGAFADIQGEICFELVDGTNVFFGNANNPSTDTSVQPYIGIVGRDMVDNLKHEAKLWKQQEMEINSITSDSDFQEQAGDHGKIEIESDEYGKALYVIIYEYDRETQTIKTSKCTQTAYMYKDIDTEYKGYPVAWLTWEKIKNCYHGHAVCTEAIPVQIFVNRSFAMMFFHLMMAAFPKAVYDADKITEWSNEFGTAIKVHGLQGIGKISDIAAYLNPGNMSNQIVEVINLAIQYMKETLGLTDAWSGNVKPDNFKAIAMTVQQAGIPLENPKANLYSWIEDIGRILLDIMGTNYGARPIIVTQGEDKIEEQFDFSVFKNLWLNIKTDVGASSYWSEIAQKDTLDNLVKIGMLTDIIIYLEALPDGYVPKKQELIEKLKAKIQAVPQPNMPNGNTQPNQTIPIEPSDEEIQQFVASLSADIQQKLSELPENQFRLIVVKMMQQAQGQ
jgi:hypothetical protein